MLSHTILRQHNVKVLDHNVNKFDLFVASPMSPFSSHEYHQNRESLITLVQSLKKLFNFKKVFCPAISVESKEAFSSSYDSVVEDLNALRSCSSFLLHYVNAVKSSAIFEAGIAYERKIPSVYIVKTRQDLPYLLREMEDYEIHRTDGMDPLVRIIEVENNNDLSSFINSDWFNNHKKN